MGVIFICVVVGLAIVLPIAALVSLLSKRVTANEKLIWILLIIFMPFVGSILYFLMGRPKFKRNSIKYSNRHFLER